MFAEKDDTPCLGATALEAMGLQVDPVTNELKPVELLMLCIGWISCFTADSVSHPSLSNLQEDHMCVFCLSSGASVTVR